MPTTATATPEALAERIFEGAIARSPASTWARFSVLHCLPSCREEEPSAATGTCMRPDTMRRYAEEAGFTSVEVLPIEHDFWRFYRLRG
jgi:hypothetical protein